MMINIHDWMLEENPAIDLALWIYKLQYIHDACCDIGDEDLPHVAEMKQILDNASTVLRMGESRFFEEAIQELKREYDDVT